jgi:hypothetical protein
LQKDSKLIHESAFIQELELYGFFGEDDIHRERERERERERGKSLTIIVALVILSLDRIF